MTGRLEGVFHLMPPWIPHLLVLVVIGLFAWVFFARLRPWWKSRPVAPQGPAPAGTGKNTLAKQLSDLEESVAKSKKYRSGLFQLSALMKAHLENLTGLPVGERTSGELSVWPTTKPHVVFFATLERLTCRREEPEIKDFKNSFAAALQIASARARKKS